MPSFSDRYPNSGFLKAADLMGQPDLVVQIDFVELDVSIGQNIRDVVRFKNDSRSLVLNRVCGQAISKLYGDEIQGWNDQWIALFCDETVEFQGNRGGVRVRPRAPEVEGASPTIPHRPQPKPDFDDEIPF